MNQPRPSFAGIHHRDGEQSAYRRFRSFDPKWRESGEGAAKHKALSCLASTSDPVNWGGWREILEHKPGAIDWEAARAVLLNHRPGQLVGPISSIRIEGNGLVVDEVGVLPDARMESGVKVQDAIESGALRGISIGYFYDEADTTWDPESRTLTVHKWRLLEVSLTPIPADDSAGLRARSLPDHITQRGAIAPKDKTPMKKFLKWLAARGYILDKLTDEQIAHLRGICDADKEPADDYAKEAREIPVKHEADEKARSERAKVDRAIATRAEGHGLKASEFIGMSESEANDAMLRAIAKRDATDAPETPPTRVTVERDAGDKLLTHARASLYRTAGIKADEDEAKQFKAVGANGTSGGMPMRQMLRLLASLAGHRGVEYWSDAELAAQMAGAIDLRTIGRRDAANKIVANFSTLLANVAHKALQGGFDSYNGATWQIWATIREVPNFLQVTNTGLASGRLIETDEGEAFPELLQKDGGYNSTLGLFGATVSVSFQALVNDQLGQILRDLKRTGALAAMTVDRLVYSKVVGGTWTNDTSTSAGLATAANLDKPRAALKAKLSPANEKLGIVGRFLLHDPANAVAAEVATGKIYGPGQTTSPSQGSKQIIPVESHWIGDTGLAGGALTTDYYLAGDPSVVDTVLVNFLAGVGQTPIIMPFDAGAVAAEKYKVMLPVQATLATHTDGASTPALRVSGMQKATA